MNRLLSVLLLICVIFKDISASPLPKSIRVPFYQTIGKQLGTLARFIDTGGIKWSEGLSWIEVREKAKRENKHILLDCFTTWCGPCKMMDSDVYPNSNVGKYFNQYFVCVRVQMDRTPNDSKWVQSWYNQARDFGKQYRIDGYPTFVFLSPDGDIVEKGSGYKIAQDFIALAQAALKPGKVYKDPYAAYYPLLADFKRGLINYEKMGYMIRCAKKMDTSMVAIFKDTYNRYLIDQGMKHKYTKTGVEYMSDNTQTSKSTMFNFFLHDSKRIDKVMKRKGCAALVIDKTIFIEYAVPFFYKENKDSTVSMTGMYIMGTDVKPKYTEANWPELEKKIQQKYGRSIAKRNVLAARIEWYKRLSNKNGVHKYFLEQLNNYPVNLDYKLFDLNNAAWDVFLHSTDKAMIDGYLEWMEKLAKHFPRQPIVIDTYANLLYKSGQLKEAIEWEQKAMALAAGNDRQVENYREIIKKMQDGRPTWE